MDVEVDLLLGDCEFLENIFARSLPTELETENGTTKIMVASLEDLILMKVNSGRLIDLADVKTLIQLNAEVDFDYLNQWATKLKLKTALDDILR